MIGDNGTGMKTLLFRCLVHLLAILPDSIVESLANSVAWLSATLPSRRLRLIRINVDKILGLPSHTSFAKTFYRQVFASQVRCLIETCREVVTPGTITLEGEEEWRHLVHRLENDGRSIIFAAAHIGSWEITGAVVARACNKQVHALAKLPKVQGTSAALEWLRGRLGLSVLWSHKKSLVRDMISSLRSGEHLAMVIDQKPEGRAGDTVQFIGKPIAFVGGPAAMSLRCNAAIVSVATVRTGAKRFRVVGGLIFDPQAAEGLKSEGQVSQLCATEIERWIRLYPEQWTWEYKRWVFSS